MVVLEHLYPLVPVGGYVLLDDYGWFPHCKAAVHDYFKKINIKPKVIESDFTGVWWKKTPADIGTPGIVRFT